MREFYGKLVPQNGSIEIRVIPATEKPKLTSVVSYQSKNENELKNSVKTSKHIMENSMRISENRRGLEYPKIKIEKVI